MQSKFYKNIINRLYDFKETESLDFQPFCCLKLSILLKTRKNGFAKCFFLRRHSISKVDFNFKCPAMYENEYLNGAKVIATCD